MNELELDVAKLKMFRLDKVSYIFLIIAVIAVILMYNYADELRQHPCNYCMNKTGAVCVPEGSPLIPKINTENPQPYIENLTIIGSN